MVLLAYPDGEYVSLEEAAGRMKAVPPDSDTLQTARDIGICLGGIELPGQGEHVHAVSFLPSGLGDLAGTQVVDEHLDDACRLVAIDLFALELVSQHFLVKVVGERVQVPAIQSVFVARPRLQVSTGKSILVLVSELVQVCQEPIEINSRIAGRGLGGMICERLQEVVLVKNVRLCRGRCPCLSDVRIAGGRAKLGTVRRSLRWGLQIGFRAKHGIPGWCFRQCEYKHSGRGTWRGISMAGCRCQFEHVFAE